MFRAKFRVLSIESRHDGLFIVRLAPVTARSPYSTSPADSKENAAFWHATPSGEIILRYVGALPAWAVPQAGVFVDFAPQGLPARWTLGAATRRSAQIDIEIIAHHTGGGAHADDAHPGLSAGELQMSIQAVPTVRRMIDVVTSQLDSLLQDAESGRTVGYAGWSVVFTRAHEPE